MRVILFFIVLFFSCNLLYAQSDDGLAGSYKRYLHRAKGTHIVQTLKLTGATGGKYTLEKEGTREPDFESGAWIRSHIEGRGRSNLDVVILDPENKFESRYYVISHIGCLTPIYENGEQIKRANSFAPVRKGRLD